MSAVDQLVPLDALSIMQKAGGCQASLVEFQQRLWVSAFCAVSNHGLAFSQRMRSHQTLPMTTSEAVQFPLFCKISRLLPKPCCQ